jgi:hypothetical protein
MIFAKCFIEQWHGLDFKTKLENALLEFDDLGDKAAVKFKFEREE